MLSRPKPVMSIVMGTLNRLPFLQRAYMSLWDAVGDFSWEVIIVDGGSTDGTLEYLERMARINLSLRVVRQSTRTGAVAAYNLGFSMAEGDYVAAFNDDAVYMGKPLAGAFIMLRKNPEIGQVALPFVTNKIASIDEFSTEVRGTPRVAEVNLEHYGRVPYANFGVIRRNVGERLGWWGEYYHYAGDTHLSAGVWYSGMSVAPLPWKTGYVIHYELQDETRLPNVETKRFDHIWRNPQRPKPAPQTEGGEDFVPMLYMGNQAGNTRYQRPDSEFAFIVSARRRDVLAPPEDAAWLDTLKQGGRKLFQKKVFDE